MLMGLLDRYTSKNYFETKMDHLMKVCRAGIGFLHHGGEYLSDTDHLLQQHGIPEV